MKRKINIIAFFFITLFFKESFSESNSIVVLMYHRFNEHQHQSTSIDKEIFFEQMKFLKDEGFTILPLSDLILFFNKKKNLPNKTIFITIDDGYKSVYKHAYPILKEFNFPFSVFLSTDFVSDSENSDFMNWEMLKELKSNNGEIYNHTSDHSSLLKISKAKALKIINKSQKILQKELGEVSLIFSYPYGESNLDIENLIREQGFKLAFSQQSGPIHFYENIFRLPRFSINNKYGEIKRFKTIVKSKPLAPIQVLPLDTVFNNDKIRFEFQTTFPKKSINCYVNNSAKIKKISNQENFILEILDLKKINYRVNCTFIDKNKNVFWFGKNFFYTEN